MRAGASRRAPTGEGTRAPETTPGRPQGVAPTGTIPCCRHGLRKTPYKGEDLPAHPVSQPSAGLRLGSPRGVVSACPPLSVSPTGGEVYGAPLAGEAKVMPRPGDGRPRGAPLREWGLLVGARPQARNAGPGDHPWATTRVAPTGEDPAAEGAGAGDDTQGSPRQGGSSAAAGGCAKALTGRSGFGQATMSRASVAVSGSRSIPATRSTISSTRSAGTPPA